MYFGCRYVCNDSGEIVFFENSSSYMEMNFIRIL